MTDSSYMLSVNAIDDLSNSWYEDMLSGLGKRFLTSIDRKTKLFRYFMLLKLQRNGNCGSSIKLIYF